MKNLLYLIIFFSLFGCEKSDNEYSSDNSVEYKTDQELLRKDQPEVITNGEEDDGVIVGQIVNGVPKFYDNKSELITAFNENTSNNFTSVEFSMVEENYYLNFYNVNGFRSSLLLNIENLQGKSYLISVVKISCKSRDCANDSTGCTPNLMGTACTKCKGGNGDCEKTVSNGNQIEGYNHSLRLEY